MNDNPHASRQSGTDASSAMPYHHNWSAEPFAISYGDLKRIVGAKLRQRLGKAKPRRSSRSKDDGDDARMLGLGAASFS